MTRLSTFKGQGRATVVFYVFGLLLLMLLSACGDGSDNNDIRLDNASSESAETGSAVFTITWHDAPTVKGLAKALAEETLNCKNAGVEWITCRVYDESDRLLKEDGPWPCNAHKATITSIPAGQNRKFVILGQTAGETLHHGETPTPIEIKPGEITDVGEIDTYSFEVISSIPENDPNGNTPVDANDFSFEWNVVKNADSYHIQVSEDTNFEQLAVDQTTTDIEFKPSGLAGATQYYWRVRALDAHKNQGPFPEYWSFITDEILTWYEDGDSDNFGNPNKTMEATTQPPGYVANDRDCDDNDPSIFPGATESCNGKDDDCDGSVDEGIDLVPTTCGIGQCASRGELACLGGQLVDSCQPGTPREEECDGLDNDCDGSIDEGLTRSTSCGVGACANNSGTETCVAGVWGNDTCDPYAGATSEVCDNVDNDCDGEVDEGLTTTFYRDADDDGFGTEADTKQDCTAPAGYVNINGDCNDNNEYIHPNASEACDGVDNNCNETIDEDVVGGCYFTEGLLHHRGTPMSEISDAHPSFMIYNQFTKDWQPGTTDYYNPTDGAYKMYNLPEDATIWIHFHIIGDRWSLPGNYESWTDWDSTKPTQLDINMNIIMHLIEPWDNKSIADWNLGEYPKHPSPAKFEWDHVPGSTSYRVYINRFRDDDHPDGFKLIERIVSEEIKNTQYQIMLPPSEDYEHYNFIVEAYEGEDKIGYLMRTHADTNDYRWDYRFKVGSNEIDIMIGDNDGYGYGISDGEQLPKSTDPNRNWIFDNQEPSEANATDGSQYTDAERYILGWPDAKFKITFTPVSNPTVLSSATFTIDVSGIQTSEFGTSSISIDGYDFTKYLPTEQGIFGSQIVNIPITDPSLFEDGSVSVHFQAGGGDAVAIDYMRLQLQYANP